MIQGIDNAGTPDTPEGEQAAKLISDWSESALDDLEKAQDSLDEEADSIEESITQLADAARAIGAALTSSLQTITEVGRTDPELAAAVQQSSTCQQLQKETS
jgi:hypothetical protein